MKNNALENNSIAREALRREASKSLLAFTIYNDQNFQTNWHHVKIGKKLDQFIRGEIRRLMIFVGPRRSKSTLGNFNLSAFNFGVNPKDEIVCASYGDSLASEMNSKTQRIMESPKYSEVFPDTGIIKMGAKTKTAKRTQNYFDVIHNHNIAGNYKSVGVGGSLTGKGFNKGIIDDPEKNFEEAFSQVFQEKIYNWYTSTFRTRMAPNAGILIIKTRWHLNDLAGRLLKLAKDDPDADQWEVVSFPEIKEVHDFKDPRRIGQVLWPERFSEKEVLATKSSVGNYVWNALYQQNPVSIEGNIIKRDHFRFYDVVPDRPRFKVISIDTSFKEGKNSDYVVGQVWNSYTKDYYLIHQIREQASFTRSLKIIEMLIKICPGYNALLIEEKANGAAIIEVLKKRFSKIIAIIPKESKEARLHAVSPLVESGCVYVPNPKLNPWVDGYLNEICTFPFGANDDMVDACFVAGTKVFTIWGNKNIEIIKKGDLVLTPFGFRRVKKTWIKEKAKVIERFGLCGTPNHPIYCKESISFIHLDSIKQVNIEILSWNSLIRWTVQRLFFFVKSNTALWELEDITLVAQQKTKKGKRLRVFMLLFLNIITKRKLKKVLKYTTKILIHLIMTLLIYGCYQGMSILKQGIFQKLKKCLNIWKGLDHSQKNGINLRKEGYGIPIMLKNLYMVLIGKNILKNVNFVLLNLNQWLKKLDFAPIIAQSNGDLKMKKENIYFSVEDAEKRLLILHTIPKIPKDCQSFVQNPALERKVFNLSVEGSETYYANNILVHNCSQALQYMEAKKTQGYKEVDRGASINIKSGFDY